MWVELVGGNEVYLPFMVKVKRDSYCGIDRNGKMWHLIWDGGSMF